MLEIAREGVTRHATPANPATQSRLRPHHARRRDARENLLWEALRNKRLEGMKFKRQVPLDGYILDFVCFEARLIIEVDGGHHSESTRDLRRDRHFEDHDFKTLRFWNDEVEKNLNDVCLAILHEAS